jgi:hypothetical protein
VAAETGAVVARLWKRDMERIPVKTGLVAGSSLVVGWVGSSSLESSDSGEAARDGTVEPARPR